jgi:NADH:ubiquinone oxidoreductase subunit D
VKQKDVFDWSFSGVMCRASGVNWDLRKSQPYEFYDKLNFQVPVGENGDCYDRYLLRIEEMRQSVAIIWQVIDNFPLGDLRGENLKITSSLKSHSKVEMEAVIHHFKLYTEGFYVNSGFSYTAVEAPKGEFGVFIASTGGSKPYRCKFRAPGYFHLQGIDFMCRNSFLADMVVVIGTQDIVFGEIDR